MLAIIIMKQGFQICQTVIYPIKYDFTGGVLFFTHVWVLLKWKSTQLNIFILWLFYLTKIHDDGRFLISCQVKVKIK